MIKIINSFLCKKSYLYATLSTLPRFIYYCYVLIKFGLKKSKNSDAIFKTANLLGIGQVKEEIESAVDILKDYKCRRVVEIGTQRGGNAFFIAQFLEGSLVTVDLDPHLAHKMSVNTQRLKTYRKTKEKMKIRKPYRAFSYGLSLIQRVLIYFYSSEKCKITPFYTCLNPEEDAFFIMNNIFHGEYIDAIFYDGDKSEYGCISSIEAYLPYLKKGGLLIIQDINYELSSGSNGMRLYWDRLDMKRFSRIGEFIQYKESHVSGIGVAIKK